jgi:hypothetical protein
MNIQRLTSKVSGVQVSVLGCSSSCIDGNQIKIGSLSAEYGCCTTDFCNSSSILHNRSEYFLRKIFALIIIAIINRIFEE